MTGTLFKGEIPFSLASINLDHLYCGFNLINLNILYFSMPMLVAH